MTSTASHLPSTARRPRALLLALTLGLIAAAVITFARTNVTSVPEVSPATSTATLEQAPPTDGDACTLRRSTGGGVLAGFEAADRCAPAPSVRIGGPIP